MDRVAETLPPITIRPVGTEEFGPLLQSLVDLLHDLVRKGPALGFLPSLTRDEAWAYWRSLRPEMQAGSRLLLCAWSGERLVGTGQLAFPQWPISQHRVELQKLFVSPVFQGRGIGRLLVAELHAAARKRGCSLILLNTRHGGPAARFYQELGYREAGTVPGFSRGPAGERYDHSFYYREI